jgi:hypothetical protein
MNAAVALTIGALLSNVVTIALFLIESAKTKEDI